MSTANIFATLQGPPNFKHGDRIMLGEAGPTVQQAGLKWEAELTLSQRGAWLASACYA